MKIPGPSCVKPSMFVYNVVPYWLLDLCGLGIRSESGYPEARQLGSLPLHILSTGSGCSRFSRGGSGGRGSRDVNGAGFNPSHVANTGSCKTTIYMKTCA